MTNIEVQTTRHNETCFAMMLPKDDILLCDECGSTFDQAVSTLSSLCPECAHWLYLKPGCQHVFEGERCNKCYWNGRRTPLLIKIIRRDAPQVVRPITCPRTQGFWRGTVTQILSGRSLRVRKGDTLFAIASGSKSFTVEAPEDGTVISTQTRVGDRVESGWKILEFVPSTTEKYASVGN